MLTWMRDRRRRELLAEPFPPSWLEPLRENVAHYGLLSAEEQARLRDDLRILIAEKHWEGCGGLSMTDEVRVTIATQACLLTLSLEHDYYPTVESILVYPAGFVATERTHSPDGVVTEQRSARLGEAWAIGGTGGPVVLSWQDALAGGKNAADGRNVVLHEFAHKLDMRDGIPNGVPRLHSAVEYDRWADVMSSEFEQLVRASEHHEATLLDKYGATDAGEFFAVATECFFERPRDMRDTHAA